MSYLHHQAVFAGGIHELSLEEIGAVSGGEAPNYSLTGQGPQLDGGLSASDVSKTAAAVSAAAAVKAAQGNKVAAVVVLVADAVGAVAGLFE